MYTLVDYSSDFVLVNKDPGVGFHGERLQVGLVDAIRQDMGTEELYPVHRLDKATSGLILLAGSRQRARELAGQFKSHLVEKYYLAVSDRRPRKKQGSVTGDMMRARRGAWKLVRSKARPAVTQFFSCSFRDSLRCFVLRPLTGKTHQLRVALKSLGSPVLGDPVYYRSSLEGEHVDRCYLHAYAIRFRIGGRLLSYSCNPHRGELFASSDFLQALARFKRPWSLAWPHIGCGCENSCEAYGAA